MHKKTGLLFLSAGLLLTGCMEQQNQVPVLAEKSEAAAESVMESEKEKERQLSLSLREQTEAPENYTNSFQVETEDPVISFHLDAQVFVPETSLAPVLELEHDPYTEEEYGKFLEILDQELGISMAEAERVTQEEMEISFADGYQMDFRPGEVKGFMPILWLRKIQDTSISSSDYAEVKLEEPLSLWRQAGQSTVMKTAQAQAERIIHRISSQTFQLSNVRIKVNRPEGQEMEHTEGDLTEDAYLWLTYVCQYNEIPIRDSGTVRMGDRARVPQYITFVYKGDGTLLAIKNIGRMKVVQEQTEREFLLPFQAITEIFEQHCRTWYLNEENRDADFGQAEEKTISCEQVSLEYRFLYTDEAFVDSSSAVFGEVQQLVPVWNFYSDAQKNELLVSIDARDGKIYAGH